MPERTNECRLLSVSSILGYGFPESSLAAGLERKPHFMGVDGGSTDPGAFYLGSRECLNSRKAMKRDLRLMLLAGVPGKIPVEIGTCGGAGAEPHLQAVAALAREVAREESESWWDCSRTLSGSFYSCYYHRWRTHLSSAIDSPDSRSVQPGRKTRYTARYSSLQQIMMTAS